MCLNNCNTVFIRVVRVEITLETLSLMNKLRYIPENPIITPAAIFTFVVVLGIGAYTLSRFDSTMKNDEARMPGVQQEDSFMDGKKTNVDTMAGTRYVQYSKTALNSASSNRRVLFFYASWCPTCKLADASFTQNASKIPGDVTVIRVNYNDPETDQEEKDLAKKYGVTYQHTFVQIDSSGSEVTKWNGGQIDELLSNIK